MVTIRNATFF